MILFLLPPETKDWKKRFRFCDGCGSQCPNKDNLARHLKHNRHCSGTGAWLKKGEEPKGPHRWSNWAAFYSGLDAELKYSLTWESNYRGAGSKTRKQVKGPAPVAPLISEPVIVPVKNVAVKPSSPAPRP